MNSKVGQLLDEISDHWDEPNGGVDRVSDMTPEELYLATKELNREIQQVQSELEAVKREIGKMKSEEIPNLIAEQVFDEIVDQVMDEIRKNRDSGA